jgi:hypothetical protein
MSRVMFGDLCIGSARSSLWARRGHAMAVQLHEQSPQMSGQSKIHGHRTPIDAARRHSATIRCIDV